MKAIDEYLDNEFKESLGSAFLDRFQLRQNVMACAILIDLFFEKVGQKL